MCIPFLHCHWGSHHFIQKIDHMLWLSEIKHLENATHYSLMDPTPFMFFGIAIVYLEIYMTVWYMFGL